MRSTLAMLGVISISVTMLLAPIATTAAEAAEVDAKKYDNWHHWRGPNFDGTSPNAKPPLEWSADKNVKWKVPVPGEGQSTPIIWENKIFLLSAVPSPKNEGTGSPDSGNAGNGNAGNGGNDERQFMVLEPDPQQGQGQGRRGGGPRGQRGRRGGGRGSAPTTPFDYTVFCFDKNNGEELWKQVAITAVPHEGKHSTSSFASMSPTTDGERLYASFGSRGVFCYTLDGKLLWQTDLGDMKVRASFGEGGAPVVHGDSLVHIWDHEGQSALFCLDAKTGEQRWKVDRDERTTWQTPLVTMYGGKTQVICNGSNRTRAYDLKDGSIIWECGGQVQNPIPSPVRMGDTVYCMSGYQGFAITAIPLSATGDVTDKDKMLWSRSDSAPYVASPLLYDGKLYFNKNRNAFFSCIDAKTGEVHYGEQRLPEISNIYASIAGADGKVFVIGRNGKTLVLAPGAEYKVLAVNDLGEGIDASPAMVGNEIFLRTTGHLWCIAEGASGTGAKQSG